MEDESGEESYREDEQDDQTSDHELPNDFESESLSIYRIEGQENEQSQ